MTDWESKELLCRSMSGRLFFCAWLLVGRAPKEVFGDAGGRLPDYWSGLERTGAGRHEAGALAEEWVLVIGRVFVHSGSDFSTAYNLARQIQIVPLATWQPSR
jgi:hypothetical protein